MIQAKLIVKIPTIRFVDWWENFEISLTKFLVPDIEKHNN